MSWNYHKIETPDNSNNLWTSYSDLFMMMSLVFLLLYVVSSLRNGTESIKNQMEYQQILMEAQDYREQNRVYNALKNNFLDTQANQEEKRLYEELITKLDLLEDEAKTEKNRLSQLATENAKKEQAINRYQKMIRNIINANMLAKANLHEKDQVIRKNLINLRKARKEIVDKDKAIAIKDQQINRYSYAIEQNQKKLEFREREITKLKLDIIEKKTALSSTKKEIIKTQAQLNARIAQLKQNEKNHATLASKIEQLKNRSSQKIKQLNTEKQNLEGILNEANTELYDLKSDLKKATATISISRREREKLLAELSQKTKQYQSEINNLNHNFERQLKTAKNQLRKELQSAQSSAKQKAAAEASYRKKAEQLNHQLAQKVAVLQNKIKQTEQALTKNNKERENFKRYIQNLEAEKNDLTKIAKESQNREKARKKLAHRMKQALDRSGIDATVNSKTGDVVLTFGDDYFDTDSARLKSSMKKTLEKFIPLYSKNLFADPKISPMVESVEIIGYASPTYRGKYVDPQSLSAHDREAVNYNLDLSYQRAKSIFEYIFDVNKMRYKYQKHLLSLINVSGRSYLSENIKGRNLQSGINRREFCSKYNCQQQQRVIIKFDLMDQ